MARKANVAIDQHAIGRAGNARDGRNVADEIEFEVRIERRVDCVRRDHHEERVAVRRRFHDHFGADIAGGARSVLDDELLAKSLRQPLTHQARDDVGRTTGRKADNDAHRVRRIGFRPRDARHRRERGSARGQMQKSSAGKFHRHRL